MLLAYTKVIAAPMPAITNLVLYGAFAIKAQAMTAMQIQTAISTRRIFILSPESKVLKRPNCSIRTVLVQFGPTCILCKYPLQTE